MAPGRKYCSALHVAACGAGRCRCDMPTAIRRQNDRLAVARFATFEPAGDKRESFYEQRLLRVLPWYYVAGNRSSGMRFRAQLPGASALGGAMIPQPELCIGGIAGRPSFEEECKRCEDTFTRPDLGIMCSCCASGNPCQ
eukprot:12413706-Karenia_brevis.AAC.1